MTFQDLLTAESLWAHTAGEIPRYPGLEEHISCDVAVIGGGLLGLSTALHLAELGSSVTVLDSAYPGWGGGGRNGGQVNCGFKLDPDELIKKFGEATGRELIEFGSSAVEETFKTIERFGIDCDVSRNGWLQLAHCAKAMGPLESRARQWQRRDLAVDVLSADKTAGLTGTDSYAGGILYPNCGSLHPLKLVSGLARSATERGAKIFANSRAIGIERLANRLVVSTSKGRVTAEFVVLATNAYTDGLLPKVRRSILPVSTFQVATEPLECTLANSIMPRGQHASDTHRALYYFRKDAEGRFLIGGRGVYGKSGLERAYEVLRQTAARIYPSLHNVRWQYRWGGMVAVTEDHLPHISEPLSGVIAAVGFNGRGIALSISLGRQLAKKMAGQAKSALPLQNKSVRPVKCHSLKVASLPVMAALYAALDDIDRRRAYRQ